ncbi:MAG: fibronectin type III-like domain-contianing protein [Gemmiger formicilis]|uniref:fibronectin type III-like domain-contianing protein n=1 Tax=Gemmiger formicilis TaxID=745368 RepID=UPI00399470B6
MTKEPKVRKPHPVLHGIGLVLSMILLVAVLVGTYVLSTMATIIDSFIGAPSGHYSDAEIADTKVKAEALAADVEAEGTVLVQNNDNTLPLAADNKKINVFGWASTAWLGGGSGSGGVSGVNTDLLAALTAYGVAYNTELTDMYKDFQDGREYTRTLSAWPEQSGRLYEPDINNQTYYTQSMLDNAKSFSDTADACLIAGLSGSEGATAVPEVLWGDREPSGRTADTWAYDLTTAASYANAGMEGVGKYSAADGLYPADGTTNGNLDTPYTYEQVSYVDYAEGIYIGYKWYETADAEGYWDAESNEHGTGYDAVVQYPFGYGLSYTSFAYSELKADARSVTLTVTNTGSRAGAEIVQVYAAKSDAQIFRPAQELKAFTKVWLEAGESKTVTLPLDDKAFRYWNTKTDSWEVEGGTYEFRVGASSADIRLTAAVEVNGTSAPNPYAGKALPHYTSGKVQHVPDDEWEILLGRPIPADTVKIDRNMTLGELNHSRSPLCWLVWAVLTMMLNASYKRGKPNLNVMFQYNMPLRALAKMTNGAISMGMVDGIVLEAKGFWVIGLLKVIVEAVKNIILNAQLESRLRNS